jgi:hypothetical protein
MTSFFRIGYSSIPEEVKVTRFTDSSVWLYRDKRRHSRLGEHASYFPSLREAIAALRERELALIAKLERDIEIMQDRIHDAKICIRRYDGELLSGRGDYIPYQELSAKPHKF